MKDSRMKYQSLLPTLTGMAVATTSAFAEANETSEADTLDEVVVVGFLERDSESAMKALVPIRDTPFSVSNYSEHLAASLEAVTVSDLFPYMTGVTRGGQSAYDLSLRGFKTTSNDRNAIMIDGLPGQVARFGAPLTAGIDRIEVVKGPASVLYGKAQPGGFVNVISKKPQAQARNSLLVRGSSYGYGEASLGDANGYGVTVDSTGPIDAGESFLYRLVADYGDRDSFRDFAFERSKYIAPSLTWQLSEDTTVTFSSEYRWRRAAQDFYLAAPNRDVKLLASRETRYQEPDDCQTEEGYAFGIAISQHLTRDISWKLAARSVRNDDASSWYDPIAVLPDLVTLQRRARSQHNQRQNDYADLSFTVPMTTGSVRHQLLLGVTAGEDSLDAHRQQFFNGASSGALARPGPGSLNIDLYRPAYGVAPRHGDLPLGQYQRRLTESQAYGIYATDFIEFSPRWKATLGLRYDHEDQLFLESQPALLPSRTKAASGSYPMVGVLFQPVPEWTLYGSYSTAFVPQAPNFQDAAGNNPFEPEQGEQFEVGVKAQVWDGALDFTIAVFDITKQNTLALVQCNAGIAGTCMQEVGEESSQGWEFEMQARPVSGWQTVLGYARADARVTRSSAAGSAPLEDSQLTNAPGHTAHLWSRYDFESGALRGLGVGFGLIHVSDQAGNQPSAANRRVLRLPGYTVADVALYYDFQQRYQMALKINNVFDQIYYDSVGSTLADVSVVPGAPRNAVLSVRVGF
jgi:iron complex outermembrane receptor protein